MSTHPPGTPIRCEMTKWGDRAHWQFEGVHLGSDEHGEWLGFPRETHNHRPGFEFHSEVDAVTLVPSGGWYAATFHAPGIWCDLYVDITTPGQWHGTVLRAVDLDLDVIERLDRTVIVDDQDEFDQHRVELGYPPEIVALAMSTRDLIRTAVTSRIPPFDGTSSAPWFDVLRRLTSP